MYYYNPNTQKKLNRIGLKNALSCSFPDGTEQVGDWYLLHNGIAPKTIPGQSIKPGPIEIVEGQYVQTYVTTGTIDTCKAAYLEILHNTWLAAEANGTVTVDGITIDATSRSNRDIEGLIISMEAQGIGSTVFCAADNSFHEVTLQQLKDFRLAVIGLGQRLYARKWELRTAIEAAETLEDLEAITISFEGV